MIDVPPTGRITATPQARVRVDEPLEEIQEPPAGAPIGESETVPSPSQPDPQRAADAREMVRHDEQAVRVHMTGAETAVPREETGFSETLTGIVDNRARQHFVNRVAAQAGIEDHPQAPTTRKDTVAKEVRIAANLGHALEDARASEDLAGVQSVERAIQERFGAEGVARIDAAMAEADAVGPRPPSFVPSGAVGRADPHSDALFAALQPLGEAQVIRRRFGPENVRRMDAAYRAMDPDARAQLAGEVRAFEEDKTFMAGLADGLSDATQDVADAGDLAWKLASDSEARTKFREDMGVVAAALADPATREEALSLIGTELGEGVLEAFDKFEEDPDYYAGYLVGPLLAGGGITKAARVAAAAGTIGDLVRGARATAGATMRAGQLAARANVDSTRALARWYGTTFVDKLRDREMSAWAFAGVNVVEGGQAIGALSTGDWAGAAGSLGIILASKVPYLAYENRRPITAMLAHPQGRRLISSVASGAARDARAFITRNEDNFVRLYADGTLRRAYGQLTAALP